MECYIVFEGEINPINAKKLADLILGINNDNKDNIAKINIFLSSYGGATYYGFSLATIIQNSSVPIVIHATNHIDSIANVVFLAAKVENRTAESHAKFFVHGATQGGTYDLEGLIEAQSAIKTENHRIVTFISENSALPIDSVTSRMANRTSMPAAEAITVGYISESIHKTIPPGAKRYE